ESAGIQTGLHYPVPLHLQQAYASLGYRAGDFPVSERVASHALYLPMFPQLTERQVDHVVAVLRAALASEVVMRCRPSTGDDVDVALTPPTEYYTVRLSQCV